jgi:hypothetical protein
MKSESLEAAFPGLVGSPYSVTSPVAREYNCIAWAVGRDDVWMWPDSGGFSYWPEAIPREVTVDAFIQAFELLGYSGSSSPDPDDGVEKVALFAQEGKPTHAARQLPDANWTSKCGKNVDISHSLRNLEGDHYGTVCRILARPRPQS